MIRFNDDVKSNQYYEIQCKDGMRFQASYEAAVIVDYFFNRKGFDRIQPKKHINDIDALSYEISSIYTDVNIDKLKYALKLYHEKC